MHSSIQISVTRTVDALMKRRKKSALFLFDPVYLSRNEEEKKKSKNCLRTNLVRHPFLFAELVNDARTHEEDKTGVLYIT
jgi:hypothetical protein